MGRTQTAKTASTKISGEVENRIVELSLQNPEFGAKRLAPLLLQKNITVSASTIYTILKRNGLQTRTKRLARTGPTPEKPKFISRKSPTRISDEIQAQITEISLQQPDYGARRLVPLLKQHGIQVSESSVYNILKRHNLQTREKRLLALETQQTVSMPEPPVLVITVPEEEPLPPQEITKEKALPSPISPAPQVVVKPIAKRSNVLVFLNILLLALIVPLGFYTVQNMSIAQKKSEVKSAVFRAKIKQGTSVRSLGDYRDIWKRNLFKISKQKPPTPQKDAAPDNIVLAEKDLGLKLIGTVVSDISRENLAIIYSSDTRGQDLYYEGDKAGEVKVKKILRNQVIITTKQGDKRLTVKVEENRQKPTATKKFASKLKLTEKLDSENGSTTIHLDRKDVESSLAAIDQVMEEITILPFTQNHQPAGIRLSWLPPDNILRKMGLRIRDVIVSVNGDPITDPEQANDFLEKLARGGDVSIYIKRNGHDRELELSIE